MNCDRFKTIAIDYLYGELEERQYEQAEAHLRECPACRDYVTEMAATLESVRKLPRMEPSQLALDNVMRAARRSIQEPVSRGFRLPRWVYHPAFALILVSLFVAGTIGLQRLFRLESHFERSAVRVEENPEPAMEALDVSGGARPIKKEASRKREGVSTVDQVGEIESKVSRGVLVQPAEAPAAPMAEEVQTDRLELDRMEEETDARMGSFGVSQATGKALGVPYMESDQGAEEVRDVYTMGVEYQNSGDYASAVSNFSQVIAVSPEYEVPGEETNVYIRRGVSNQILGNYAEAVRDFKKSAELFPSTLVLANELIVQTTGEIGQGR